VVADSSKFGHTSLALLCGLSDIDALVVDGGITDAWRERLAAAGVRLLVAGAENPA
jgi:DeoR/GlpR family transcriptional regulator of sugar metabolism